MLKFSTTLIFWLILAQGLNGQQVEPAEPISGSKLTRDFIFEELVYPLEGLKNKTEGTVKLSFVVDAKGDVEEIKVVNSVSPALDKEAIRVFSMIMWKPAYRLGQPVASMQEYEFEFDTKKYKKQCRKRGYQKHELPHKTIDTSLRVYSLPQVEVSPQPLFREKGMTIEKFMQENLQYPSLAYRQSISGTVRLNFIVEAHGRISNITIGSSVGGGCNEEAIRLLKMLKWMPAIKDGKAVRTRMHMDITFNLSSGSDLKVIDYNRNTSL